DDVFGRDVQSAGNGRKSLPSPERSRLALEPGLIDETKHDLRLLGEVMIYAYELLAPVFRNREVLQEVEKAGGVRERENVIQQKPRILVDPAGWNPVVRERLSRRRIEDGLPNPVRLGREIAVPHRFGRRGGANDLGLAAPAPLLREEEERLVPVPVVEPGNDDGPAEAITKIIEAQGRLARSKEVSCVERIVADILVRRAVKIAGPTTRHYQHVGATGSAIFRTVVAAQNLHFGNSLHAGIGHLCGLVAHVGVLHAVEHQTGVLLPLSIDRKPFSAREADPLLVGGRA